MIFQGVKKKWSLQNLFIMKKRKPQYYVVDKERYKEGAVNSDVEELLIQKYGKESIEKLRKEKEKLPEKARHMKELYKTHKDLTAFSILDKEDFYDYDE